MAIKNAEDASFEYSVPLVIVGAGACGLTAALTAKKNGVEVLVLERDKAPTGSTSLSAGLVPAAGTRLQAAKGIDDSPEIFAADLRKKAHETNDPVIVVTVARASGPTVDWLVESCGLDLHVVEGFLYPGHSRPRMHGPKSQAGSDLQGMLLAAAAAADIDILTSASVQDLYADPNGKIVGVGFSRPDGSTETIGCEALILACNGFGGNRDKVRQYIPEMADAQYGGHTSNTGDALDWGLALGADTRDLGSYQGHASFTTPHGALLTWSVITLGGVQVNLLGRRFSNEMLGYSEQAEQVLKQPDKVAWAIYDTRCEAAALPFQEYKDLKVAGAIREADSIEELAQVTGLPVDALRETLQAVEKSCAGAEDAFGRNFTAYPPLTAPFRAAKVTGALFHTQGGLVIDTNARVLRPDGTALPNLFAGGGAARGLSGDGAYGYLSGNGLLSAIVLGRLAALEACRQLS